MELTKLQPHFPAADGRGMAVAGQRQGPARSLHVHLGLHGTRRQKGKLLYLLGVGSQERRLCAGQWRLLTKPLTHQETPILGRRPHGNPRQIHRVPWPALCGTKASACYSFVSSSTTVYVAEGTDHRIISCQSLGVQDKRPPEIRRANDSTEERSYTIH